MPYKVTIDSGSFYCFEAPAAGSDASPDFIWTVTQARNSNKAARKRQLGSKLRVLPSERHEGNSGILERGRFVLQLPLLGRLNASSPKSLASETYRTFF